MAPFREQKYSSIASLPVPVLSPEQLMTACVRTSPNTSNFISKEAGAILRIVWQTWILACRLTEKLYSNDVCPDSKVHGANMGHICGRQDPDGPHGGPMNFAFWVVTRVRLCAFMRSCNTIWYIILELYIHCLPSQLSEFSIYRSIGRTNRIFLMIQQKFMR